MGRRVADGAARWKIPRELVAPGGCGYNQHSMFDSARFLIFLSAAILLAIAPGPGMLYVLALALGAGRREALLSALGTFFDRMVHLFAAAPGFSFSLAK